MSATSRAAQPRGGGDERVPAFDGLRAVALLLVMIFHVNRLFPVPSPAAPLLDRLVARAAEAGWCGVDLFFVLSGFLVTRLLLEARAGTGSLPGFYGRRALRIVPAYYTFLAVLMVAAPVLAVRGEEVAVLRANLGWYCAFLVNGLVVRHGWEGTPLHSGHLWSLAIEAHFYLLWPMIVWRVNRRALRVLCVAAFFASTAGRLAFQGWGMAPEAGYVFTLTHLEGLAAGCLLALVLEKREQGRRTSAALLAACAIGSLGILLFAGLRGTLQPTDPVVALAAIPSAALAGAGVVGLAWISGGPLARVLSRPVLTAVGRYSYAAYLFHDPITLLVLRWHLVDTGARGLDGSTLWARIGFLLVVAALTAVAALLSWHLVERHAMAVRRRWPGPAARPRLPEAEVDVAPAGP